MERRPLPRFLRRMRKEEPPSYLLDKLINNHRAGGVPFEDDVKPWMGDLPRVQMAISDLRSRQLANWVYVGEYWWGLRVERPGVLGRYVFARLMAIINDAAADKLDGLWDARRHTYRPEPVVVYEGERVGRIVARNEVEVCVLWDGQRIMEAVDVSRLRFKYEEDYREYSKIRKTCSGG